MASSSPTARLASEPEPGPDADGAFKVGLIASVVLSLLAVSLSVWGGYLTAVGGAVLVVLGLPAVFVVTACLLAVWLGYDRDAVDAFELTESARDYAEENH